MSERSSHKYSDDWEGHPHPERILTIEVASNDLIFNKLKEAQAISVENDGIGVELNFRGGFNIALVYPDSNLFELHQTYLRNIELVRQSQRDRNIGELALRRIQKGTAPVVQLRTA